MMLQEEPKVLGYPYGYGRDFLSSGEAIKYLLKVCQEQEVDVRSRKVVISGNDTRGYVSLAF